MGKNRTFLFPVSLFWLYQFWFERGEVEFSGDRDEERDPEDPWSGQSTRTSTRNLESVAQKMAELLH